MKNISIIYFVIFSIMFGACKNSAAESPAQEPASMSAETAIKLNQAQAELAAITTAKASNKKLTAVLKVNGKIDLPPQNLVSVSVPLGGYLKSTRLLPGASIAKGETIATMEDQLYIQLQQDYLQAKSKLNYATLEYNRQRDLQVGQASSAKLLEQAQAEVDNQQIMLASLGEKLKLIGIQPDQLHIGNISKSISIKSPINGYVSKVLVNMGKYVNPNEELFELIDPSMTHLYLKVYEKDVNKLAVGQQVYAYTNNDVAHKYAARIHLINKDINEDGTTDVHCHFDKVDKKLLPGMYMNGEIAVDVQSATVLPESSIINYEGKNYVFYETSKDEYELSEIKIGLIENDQVEVFLPDSIADKNIVTTGAYTLLMKLKNVEE
jgi:cobalt-zinc-cadmium efflux system membrane fusion protein